MSGDKKKSKQQRADFVKKVYDHLGIARPSIADGILLRQDSNAVRPPKIPRSVEPLREHAMSMGSVSKPSVEFLGDSELVTGWINATVACRGKNWRIVFDTQKSLFKFWKSNFAEISDAAKGSWLTHIFREQNKLADEIADRASRDGVPSLMLLKPYARPVAIRLMYDGTAGKHGGTWPAAGVTVLGSSKEGEKFESILECSIPCQREADSTDAELLGCVSAIRIMDFYFENQFWPKKISGDGIFFP